MEEKTVPEGTLRLRDLFFSFFKIGAFTFGGGYAMLPIIQKELIENRRCISREEVVDYYAVSQCIPGVIAVNTAGFIGHKLRGKPGLIAAALGVVTPSVIIITIIAAFINNFLEYPVVQNAFYGIRIVVCALILEAILKLWKSAIKDAFGFAVYLAVLVLSLATGIPTVALILLSLAGGIIADSVKRRLGSRGEGEAKE